MKRILGVDPGLQRTGWGIITAEGNALSFVASGMIRTSSSHPLCERLRCVHDGLKAVIGSHRPTESAVEETFVSVNGASTLKLGQARGAALLALALAGLEVHEYAATLVKKTVTGAGRAEKSQVGAMVARLLPGCRAESADAADALAVAICHAQHASFRARVKESA